MEKETWEHLVIETIDATIGIALCDRLDPKKADPKVQKQRKACRDHAIMCLSRLTAPFDYTFPVELREKDKSE